MPALPAALLTRQRIVLTGPAAADILPHGFRTAATTLASAASWLFWLAAAKVGTRRKPAYVTGCAAYLFKAA